MLVSITPNYKNWDKIHANDKTVFWDYLKRTNSQISCQLEKLIAEFFGFFNVTAYSHDFIQQVLFNFFVHLKFFILSQILEENTVTFWMKCIGFPGSFKTHALALFGS